MVCLTVALACAIWEDVEGLWVALQEFDELENSCADDRLDHQIRVVLETKRPV
jgi:DNA topoisomerase IB